MWIYPKSWCNFNRNCVFRYNSCA